MAVIVAPASLSVEQLSHRSRLPSPEALRPACCPSCDHPARVPGEPLWIVGHGTYVRQVLGRASWGERLLILVRRYLCKKCGRTMSVLPSALYPGRWYAGIVIFACLFLSLLAGRSESEIHRRYADSGDGKASWRSLWRWRRELLCPLWSWLAHGVGSASARAGDRDEQARRLQGLLALHGVGPPSALAEVESAAMAMVAGTVHDGVEGRPVLLG